MPCMAGCCGSAPAPGAGGGFVLEARGAFRDQAIDLQHLADQGCNRAQYRHVAGQRSRPVAQPMHAEHARHPPFDFQRRAMKDTVSAGKLARDTARPR